MQPAPDAIRKLREINPTLRWAYDNTRPGEVFTLVQILSRGADDLFIQAPWGRRGPIFGQPFDSDRFVALVVSDFPAYAVNQLEFVPLVRRWQIPLAARMLADEKRANTEHQRRKRELAEKIGDEFYHANHEDTLTVAKKFQTEAERAAGSDAPLAPPVNAGPFDTGLPAPQKAKAEQYLAETRPEV